jgi:hypothetical protein
MTLVEKPENSLRLAPAAVSHMAELMEWFPTRESCAVWGGPDFRFPFTPASFIEDSKLQSLASFVLIDAAGATRRSRIRRVANR